MSFGRSPYGLLAPRNQDDPPRAPLADGPKRDEEDGEVIVPPDARSTNWPPMIGMGMEGLRRFFSGQRPPGLPAFWIDLKRKVD